MTLSRYFLGSAAWLAAMAASLPALAESTYLHQRAGGTSCRPRYQSGGANVTYEDRGVGNLSTSAEQVFCPANLTWYCGSGGQLFVDTVSVHYQDNSSSSNFSCYAYQTTADGWQFWSTPKYTCSVWGGCTDVTSSFTGFGTLSLASPAPAWIPANYGVACSIAAGNGTWGGASWVIGHTDYYHCG